MKKGNLKRVSKRCMTLLLAILMTLTSAFPIFAASFSDVKPSDWFYHSVDYVADAGIMAGYESGQFGSYDDVTREQFAALLYRIEGSPEVCVSSTAFKDVSIGSWYAQAVFWANSKKIISGYNANTFGTGDSISREQIAAMMYRYANYKYLDTGKKVSTAGFPDAYAVSGYAKDAVEWALGNQILSGKSIGGTTRLDPRGHATRAESAAILQRFVQRCLLDMYIPPYSGSPHVVVNGNQPLFSGADRVNGLRSFELYSVLDRLGRCQSACASIGLESMPPEGDERGDISSVRPSGWQSVKYDVVPGNYLYNRCHLIGYQLSDEDANSRNLITGTRYLNVEGMLPFEDIVADYIKETENHVLYRVTPQYIGNNLVASGVFIEAYSVEDGGEGICFYVYCYNVQPGITINYQNGNSYRNNESVVNPTPTPTPVPNPVGNSYVANTKTKKFHYSTCSSANSISAANRWEYVGTRVYLVSLGYDPCKRCNP